MAPPLALVNSVGGGLPYWVNLAVYEIQFRVIPRTKNKRDLTDRSETTNIGSIAEKEGVEPSRTI